MLSKKAKLLICVCALTLICLSILCACNTAKKYDAVLFDSVGEYVKIDKMQSCLDFDESNRYARNNAYFIVQSKEDFEEIFTGFPCEIDFSKRTLLLMAKGFCTDKLKYKIGDLNLGDGKLTLNYKVINKNPDAPCVTSPYVRYIALLLNKVEINEFEFEE